MANDLIKIYSKELKFLLKLKESVGLLNNHIHDTLAAIAIEKLRSLRPNLNFKYEGAGVGGPDIQAFNKGGRRIIIAEVKTTQGDTLRGPQEKAIKKDLNRLKNQKAKYKFLILLSPKIKGILEKKYKKRYPKIKFLNPLEE